MVGGSGAARLGSVRRSTILVGALAGITLGGCGGGSAPHPELYVGVGADWNWDATSAAEVGFVYALVVEQRKNSAGTCDDLPPSLQVIAFGQPVPLSPDADNCSSATVAAAPTMASSLVTVTAEQDGKTIATGTFDNLIPGLGATLIAPPDGMIRPGGEIVIAATSGLPSSNPGVAWVFPLDETPWPGSQYSASRPVRYPDGVHTTMPAFSGRAAVVVSGTPYVPRPAVSCDGFAICTGTATNILGPVFVTETM